MFENKRIFSHKACHIFNKNPIKCSNKGEKIQLTLKLL